jgi:arylsulfatase A-like enzyme
MILARLFILALLATSATVLAGERRPNVLYILADDLGYGELGSYDQQLIKTPHLDRLAKEGMRFTQHYSGAPVCAPARGSLQTGKHTGRAYIRDNFELPESQLPLPADEFTIGELMQSAGYRTGFIGKWGLGGNDSEGQPNRQGYDFFYGYLDQKIAHNYYPTHLWRNDQRERLEGNHAFSAHQPLRGLKYLWLSDARRKELHKPYQGKVYAPDRMLEESLAFLQEQDQRPFFLVLASLVPHLALQVPDDSLQQYLGQFEEEAYKGTFGYTPHGYPSSAYAAMITRMDRDIGRILAALEMQGMADNTLVIFSSDNGPTFAPQVDTELFNSAGPFRGLKASVYEGGIRVPMIARWPGVIAPGSESDHISAFWDLMPTLAQITGTAIAEDIDGISFLPTLRGSEEQQSHQSLYWEYHSKGGMQAVLFRAAPHSPLEWKAVRTDASRNPGGQLQLFNLNTDPGEAVDVAGQHPELVTLAQSIIEQQRVDSPVSDWNFH